MIASNGIAGLARILAGYSGLSLYEHFLSPEVLMGCIDDLIVPTVFLQCVLQ